MSTYPVTIGTDPPAPSQANGYALNHMALIVTDLPSMRHFYGTILGVRHIITYRVSPGYLVTYMGHTLPDGFQTGDEMLKDLRHRNGLLEFLCPVDLPEKNNTSTSAGNSEDSGVRRRRFSHLGIVVPDLKAAEDRMREVGVKILKALGDERIEPGSSVAEWWGMDNEVAVEAAKGARGMEWGDTLLVLDPEGNVVEVQERE